MKPFRLLLIVACFSIICALFSGVGSALEPDEARVTPIWSNETPYRGSSVTVEIFFINDYFEELTIHRVGLHLDWMDPDSFIGHDISDDPVTVPSHGGHSFYPINILIPEDASVGTHSYFVGIEGIQGESTDFFWNSPTRTLLIQDSEEEVSNEGTHAESQQDQLLIIVGVVVVVVVAVLIIILMVRKKRKQTAPIEA